MNGFKMTVKEKDIRLLLNDLPSSEDVAGYQIQVIGYKSRDMANRLQVAAGEVQGDF